MNGGREIFIFPVQLTTSRIGNLTRLILTLAIYATIHGLRNPNHRKMVVGKIRQIHLDLHFYFDERLGLGIGTSTFLRIPQIFDHLII